MERHHVQMTRTPEGSWQLKQGQTGPAAYVEALPRFATHLDRAFTRAREKCELEFICALLRIRGLTDLEADVFETSLQGIPAVCEQIENSGPDAAWHLKLWLYGHVVEASEPYEILGNMIEIAAGRRWQIDLFPDHEGGRPMSPGEKTRKLKEMGKEVGLEEVAIPLEEIWNRDLRNSIFHADYVLNGEWLYTLRPAARHRIDDVHTLVNKALAYFDAVAGLYELHVRSYGETKSLTAHPGMNCDPEEKLELLIRKDHGVIGFCSDWTPQQVSEGKIPLRLGKFTRNELNMMNSDSARRLFPAVKRRSGNRLGFLHRIRRAVSILLRGR